MPILQPDILLIRVSRANANERRHRELLSGSLLRPYKERLARASSMEGLAESTLYSVRGLSTEITVSVSLWSIPFVQNTLFRLSTYLHANYTAYISDSIPGRKY
jgi:hypothetical protein